MDALRICAGISHRSFPGCSIILDLERDRYWQVDAEASIALDWIARRASGPIDPRHFDRLLQLGLVERAENAPAGESEPDLPMPTRSAVENTEPSAKFNSLEATEVAYLAMLARYLVRRRPLRWNIANVTRRRTYRADRQVGSVEGLARRFSSYRRLVPLPNKCLPDTLAFLRFANRRGHFPRLVFGVEAWPFAAHCWAQAGELVLNDALDHARAFSPILAI